MSVRHTSSNSLEHRGVKQADSKSNTQIPKIEEATHFPLPTTKSRPPHADTVRNPIPPKNEQQQERLTEDRRAPSSLGASDPTRAARKPPVGGRGSGGELEKLPSSRATADGVSSPFLLLLLPGGGLGGGFANTARRGGRG
jgi:hypothetical protein